MEHKSKVVEYLENNGITGMDRDIGALVLTTLESEPDGRLDYFSLLVKSGLESYRHSQIGSSLDALESKKLIKVNYKEKGNQQISMPDERKGMLKQLE